MTRKDYIKCLRAISMALAPVGVFPLIVLSQMIASADFSDGLQVCVLWVVGGAGMLLILYGFVVAPWLLFKRFGEAAVDAFAVQVSLASAMPIYWSLKAIGLNAAWVFLWLVFYVLLRAWLHVVLE